MERTTVVVNGLAVILPLAIKTIAFQPNHQNRNNRIRSCGQLSEM